MMLALEPSTIWRGIACKHISAERLTELSKRSNAELFLAVSRTQ